MPISRSVLVSAAVLTAGLLAGCSTSGYTYVEHSGADAYFKVPDDWQVYIVDDGGEPTDRPTADDTPTSEVWRRIFDADPLPDAAHVTQAAPDFPVGDVSIIPLSASVADTLNMATLRSATFGSDPLTADGVEVVTYETLSGDGGYRGMRIVFNAPQADGSFETVDYTAYMNPDSTIAYLFTVRCASQCYLDHRSEIDAVVSSWTVGSKQ